MQKILYTLFIFLLLQQTGFADVPINYYVSPGGDDNNTCTEASQPCRTIKAAVDKAPVGHWTIKIARGVYTEDTIKIDGHRFLTLEGGWNWDFSQQNKNPGTVFIRGISQGNAHEYLFYLSIFGQGNEAGLTFKYLTFTQGSSSAIDEALEFRAFDSARAWLTIDHCAFTNFSLVPGSSNNFNIIIAGSANNGQSTVTITNSYFTGNINSDNSVNANVFCSYTDKGSMVMTMDNCKFLRNGNQSANLSPVEISASSAGSMTAKITNTIIAGNTIRGGSSVIVDDSGDSSSLSLEMTNTTITDNHSSFSSHINGLWAKASDSSTLQINCTNTMIARNSIPPTKEILFQQEDPASLTFTADYCILGGRQTIGTVSYNSSHEVHGDPLLDSTYHLIKGSAAINAGICGKLVDIGGIQTYERVAPLDDIDGDKRPGFGKFLGCDIGADEYKPFSWPMFLPAIVRPHLNPTPFRQHPVSDDIFHFGSINQLYRQGGSL